MKAQEVIGHLPEGLAEYTQLFIKSEQYDDPLAPPSQIQDVVWLAETKPSSKISDDVVAWIVEWLESREDASGSAAGLIEQIHGRFPCPSREEVISGASLPEYTIADWYKVLFQPWSRSFERSIEQGWKWLKQQ